VSSPSPFGAAKTEQNNNCHYLIPTSTLPAPLQCAPQYIEIFIYHAVLLCAQLRWSFTIYSQINPIQQSQIPQPPINYQFPPKVRGDQQNSTLNVRKGSRYCATSCSYAITTSAGAKTPPALPECLHRGHITS